jgi:nitrogen fixation/metabolism regulation signal transduction histidine kinase
MEENLPNVPVRAQQMQKVFFDLLFNGRYALNKRYAGRDVNKIITVNSKIFSDSDGGRQFLQVSIDDKGYGMTADEIERLLQSSSLINEGAGNVKQGLATSLKIVEDHGGTLEIASIPAESTTAILSFPVM